MQDDQIRPGKLSLSAKPYRHEIKMITVVFTGRRAQDNQNVSTLFFMLIIFDAIFVAINRS